MGSEKQKLRIDIVFRDSLNSQSLGIIKSIMAYQITINGSSVDRDLHWHGSFSYIVYAVFRANNLVWISLTKGQ